MSNRSLKASEQAYWKSYKEEKDKKQKKKESEAKKQQKEENAQRLASKKRRVAQELDVTGQRLNRLEQKKQRLADADASPSFAVEREPMESEMEQERDALNRLHWRHRESQEKVASLKVA
jgi:hypothetical protein